VAESPEWPLGVVMRDILARKAPAGGALTADRSARLARNWPPRLRLPRAARNSAGEAEGGAVQQDGLIPAARDVVEHVRIGHRLVEEVGVAGPQWAVVAVEDRVVGRPLVVYETDQSG